MTGALDRFQRSGRIPIGNFLDTTRARSRSLLLCCADNNAPMRERLEKAIR